MGGGLLVGTALKLNTTHLNWGHRPAAAAVSPLVIVVVTDNDATTMMTSEDATCNESVFARVKFKEVQCGSLLVLMSQFQLTKSNLF